MFYMIIGITVLVGGFAGYVLAGAFGLPGVFLSIPAGLLIGMVGGQIAYLVDESY